MYHVNIKSSLHLWDKKNLVSKPGRKGHYDEVVCAYCAMKGRRYTFAEVAVSESYSRENAYLCPKAPKAEIPQKIRVTLCTAQGNLFSNLTPNSEHDVVTPPKGYANDHTGVWVMGVGEPVKLLPSEFVKL